jgi:nucleotide-binding universal stress UspA family protein
VDYGHALETILETSVELKADITLVGKKTTYKGTGLILSAIASFMENSVLFVPEQTRTSIDQIMVPIDFTEASLTALKAAAQFAAKSKAQITAQHVVELPAQFFPLTTPTEELADKARKVLRAKADKLISQSELKDQTIEYVFSLSEGRKLSEIVRHEALQQMADMIILGSKGKNPTSALFRGTVVEKLVQSDFSVPLFIIKDKKRMKGLLNFFQKAET